MNVNHGKTFVPTISSDVMVKNGYTSTISTKHMTITMMDEFKDKSFEELHLENYNAKNSGFGDPIGESSISKQNDTDGTVNNENDQMNDIKDLVDELVSTLCKMMLKINHITFKNRTPATVNQQQENNKSGSFPSTCVEIRPSFIHSPKFNPFRTNLSSNFKPALTPTARPTVLTDNSFNFKRTPPPSFNTTMSSVNNSTTSNPVELKNKLFSFPNSNSNSSTTTSWPLTSTTNSCSVPNNPSQFPPFTFKPSSSFLNDVSTLQSKPFTTQSTFPPHSNWEKGHSSQLFKFPTDNCFTRLSTTPVTTNSLPSSSFNNNAKLSSNLINSNFNSKNHNSFPTQIPHTPLFKPTSSSSNSIWTDKFVNPLSSNLFNTKNLFEKSESTSTTSPCKDTIPLTAESNSTLTSVSNENTNKETVEKKELNDDELVSSIVNCIESLKTIAFQAQKSKLIGVCEKFDTVKTNILKSSFIQLRVMNSRFLHYEKSAFVSESTGILNTTLKNNILVGKPFNPQLYYGAIALCCLKEDIDSLQFGDSTQIGDDGVELSDAQKQKIAFARAFYADKDIYFLNNAFNKIDSKDARYMFETLILGALKNKIIILMDDTPSYFSHCDKVYILNKGKVVEESDHKSLLKTNTFYASLIDKNNSNHVVIKDTSIDGQSSNANEKSIVSVPQSYHDSLKVQNDNTGLKQLIQSKIVENTETINTLERKIENIESPKNSEVEVNNDQNYNSITQKENEIRSIEPKISNQQNDKEEEQLKDSAGDENDEEASSINSENDEEASSINSEKDEAEKEFEIC